MTFSEELKRLRESAGITQEVLAQRAGTSVGNVRNYEQGIRLPTFPLVVKLSKALGVSCTAFVNCDDVSDGSGVGAFEPVVSSAAQPEPQPEPDPAPKKPNPPASKPAGPAVGVSVANEAIDALMRIFLRTPRNSPHRSVAFRMVKKWLETNE